MKKFSLLLCASIFFMFSVASAFAMPVLEPGPLFIKFSGKEQLSASDSILVPGTGIDPDTKEFSENLAKYENSWGIFRVDTIATGEISTDPQEFEPGSLLWTRSALQNITGIFFGMQSTPSATGIASTNGEIHFYWNEGAGKGDLTNALPTGRTSESTFTGFTEGIFLGAMEFLNGGILQGSPLVSVTGNLAPTTSNFNLTGYADSFGVVKDIDGDGFITADKDGLWSELLNSAYFYTALTDVFADAKFKNSYRMSETHAWNDINKGIFGANLDDPLMVYATPEPGTLLLLGAGFLGLAAFSRRRMS